MSVNLDILASELVPFAHALVDVATSAGVNPVVTSTIRTHSEQLRLYTKFRAGLSAYPAAPPGRSAHEYGYAFDMILRGGSASDQGDLGQVWRSWGGQWSVHDAIHFEYPNWQALVQLGTDARPEGGLFAKLVDFLSGFVPFLGEAQLADSVFRALHGDETLAEWYLQHPVEALRDLLGISSSPSGSPAQLRYRN